MLASPPVDAATPDDLAPLVQLRLGEGWHRNDALLTALMEWDGGRVFVVRASADSASAHAPIVASASALAAGPTGVIGNVVVHEDSRGSGLGRRVMESALEWMRGRGVRSVLLDATVSGRPLYRKLGFVGIGRSWFTHSPIAALDLAALSQVAGSSRASVRDPASFHRYADLDHAAFGGDRFGLLRRMLAQPATWLYAVDDASGAPAGFAMLRLLDAPILAVRMGPLVATNPAAAASLLHAAVAADAPWRSLLAPAQAIACRLSLNLPGTNASALALAQSAGAELELDDLIMQLDFDRSAAGPEADAPAALRPVSAHPEWLYAWLAPMVF